MSKSKKRSARPNPEWDPRLANVDGEAPEDSPLIEDVPAVVEEQVVEEVPAVVEEEVVEEAPVVEESDDSSSDSVVANATRVPIFQRNTASSGILGFAKKGNKMTVLAQIDERWYRVKFKDLVGFVVIGLTKKK